ncbi:hypothetical protein Hanom_Chr08g00693821 [Helianthus anomalus]
MRESQHLPMKQTLNLHTSLINAATTTCMRDSFKGLHLFLLEPLISRRFLNRNKYVSYFFSFFSFDSNCYSPHSSSHVFCIISPTLFE